MSEENRFGHIFEGEEIKAFLESFVAPGDGSAPHMPKTADAVLDDVRAVWKERGLLSPAELRAELVTLYMPEGTPREVVDFARETELSRNAPERTTQYLGKEHAYLGSALAHLYAVEMDRPVAHFELDASNMGGTNDFFERLLRQEAAEKGLAKSDAEFRREAEAMTDKAVLLLCASIAADIGRENPDAKIIPMRAGGDEFRIHFDNVAPERYADIAAVIHENIERHVARMGLQDHGHLKAPGEPVRHGFGLALTAIDMRDIDDPGGLIEELDTKIKNVKDHLGLIRLGVIDAEIERAEIRADIRHGNLIVPPGMSEKDFINDELSHRAGLAYLSSGNLRAENPLHNGAGFSSAAFHAYADKALAELGAASPIVHAPLPAALARDLTGENRPEGVAPLAPMETRRMAAALRHFEDDGIALTAAQKHVLSLSVRALEQRDPAAQALMPGEMIRNMEICAAESREYQYAHGLQGAAAMPRAAGVSIHGLAALNGTFGHHTADIALRHMRKEIIEGALDGAGIDKAGCKIAHHGGGNFTACIGPGADDAAMRKFMDEVSRRAAEFGNTDVAAFLRAKGVEVDDAFENALREQGVSTFADLPDTKEREIAHGGRKIRARVDGIHASAVTADIAGEKGRMGDFIGALRRDSDAKMDKLREGAIVDRFVSPPASDSFLNSRFAQQPATPPAEQQAQSRPPAPPKSQPPKPAA